MHTSWSEIETAQHCLRKHHYKYKERWRDKEEGPALLLGNQWHELMAELYGTGDESAPIELMKRWQAEGTDTNHLAWMLEGYYERWGLGDPLWQRNAVMVEERMSATLPDVGNGPMELVFVVDLLVKVMGKLWIVDHKSSKYEPRPGDLDMADQWTLYTWALRQKGYDVFGSVHNFAKTERLKTENLNTLERRYSRTPIHRTARECEAVAQEAATWAWLAKMDNGAPRSIVADACYRRCGFADACVADRRYGTRQAEHILSIRNYQKPTE